MQVAKTPRVSQFARDVFAGLTATPKHLSSRYFYDAEGSRLFMEIMDLPEYYLTRAELKIFTEQTQAIHAALTGGVERVSLIELGAGDGLKTSFLIEYFLSENIPFDYSPIDISQEANDALAARFRAKFPQLSLSPHTGDYFQVLDSLRNINETRKVIMFLGSNIGNFQREDAISFFRSLREVMDQDDLLFIGFDLQKDPRVIAQAYDDSRGVTAAFNLNLLTRINRELDANFDIAKFSHYAHYRPVLGEARSFLISREKQTVRIGGLDLTVQFEQWEAIFMEISQKYTRTMIGEMAYSSGFEIVNEFLEPAYFYVNSLWRRP